MSYKKVLKNSCFIVLIILLTSLSVFSEKNKPVKVKGVDNSTCLGCHDDPTITMNRKGKDVSLTVKSTTLQHSVHASLNCQQCHQGFNPDDIPHKANITPVNCMNCHKDAQNLHLFHPQMKTANMSVLSPINNCKNCHGTHEIISPKTPNSKLNYINSTNFCGNCHKDKKAEHLESEHAVELSKNNPNSPTCIYCHRQPVTQGYKMEQVAKKLNQEKLCKGCHLKNPQNQFSKALINYDKSVHGAAIRNGNKNAAVCIDCHGVHNLKKAANPQSSVNHFRIPEVCGKCHISIAREYLTSIHGMSLKKGNSDSPGCTYCHGEHSIKPMEVVTEKIITENQMNFNTITSNKMVFCVGCHSNEQLMKKYNISTIQKAHEWLPSKSAHWETVRCVDCHSSYEPPNLSHNILPPGMTIKKCENCHSKNSILIINI